MDIKEVASRILKASFLHSGSGIANALLRESDPKAYQDNLDIMKKAEEQMVEALTDFQNSILEKAKQ